MFNESFAQIQAKVAEMETRQKVAAATNKQRIQKAEQDKIDASKRETSVFTDLQEQLTNKAKEQAKIALGEQKFKTAKSIRKSKDKSFMTQAALSDLNDNSGPDSAQRKTRAGNMVKHAEESARNAMNINLAQKISKSNNKSVTDLSKQNIINSLVQNGSSIFGGGNE